MESFLAIQIIWQDDEMVEIQVSSANVAFCGKTEVYTCYEHLAELADKLSAFPKSATDKVGFVAGEKKSYSYAELNFYCFHGAGHTAVLVELESNVAQNQRMEEKHKILMEVQCEAEAIRNFRKQLLELIQNKNGEVVLNGIRPYTQNISKP
jgi:hypothetical protein